MARIGILIGPMFEDVEYTKPAEAMREEGHELVHVSTARGSVKGKRGTEVGIDETVQDITANDFDALFIPGGFSPDKLRADEEAVEFVRNFMDTNKPVFAICHGPQLLMSADRVEGRKLTAWKTVQKDLKYADAEVVDEEVVKDGNLITSRQPDDIPAFIRGISEALTTV